MGVTFIDSSAIDGLVADNEEFIYKPPPTSRNLTVEIQASVSAQEDWQGVLAVVARDGDLMDFRNTSTAVHRVARHGHECRDEVFADRRWPLLLAYMKERCCDFTAWGVSDCTWGLAKLQCRDDEAFRLLSARAREILDDLDPQALALVCWGFASLGCRDEMLIDALISETRRKLRDFSPQNMANLSWAMAVLAYPCGDLIEVITRRATEIIIEFTAQELANLNWAAAKLGVVCDPGWRTAYRTRILQISEFEPAELSMIAWSLAARMEYDPELMGYVAFRSVENMRRFTGQNLSTVLWAMATVSYKDDPSIDEVLRCAIGAVIGRANDFSPLNLALIAWGFAKLAYKADAAFESICVSAMAQMRDFVPQNLVQVAWACATVGYRNDAFLRSMSGQFIRCMEECSPQHISNLIWACARLGWDEDKELLRAISREAKLKMGEVSATSQHLSNIAWAVSTLGVEHFDGLLEAVVQHSAARMDIFDTPSITMLNDALFEAKFTQDGVPGMAQLQEPILKMRSDLETIYTKVMPVAPPGTRDGFEVGRYQQRLRSVGLTTLGYEHTTALFGFLSLTRGEGWKPTDVQNLDGWTANARRSFCARRYALTINSTAGMAALTDPGSVFVSAFAPAEDDAAGPFVAAFLGKGKDDSPNVGRQGRIGDAEARAIIDTHEKVCGAANSRGSIADIVSGYMKLHVSGVPCLSCVGVMAQFAQMYPNVEIHVTFAQRERGFFPTEEEGPKMDAAPQFASVRNITRAPSNPERGGNEGGVSEPVNGALPPGPRPPREYVYVPREQGGGLPLRPGEGKGQGKGMLRQRSPDPRNRSPDRSPGSSSQPYFQERPLSNSGGYSKAQPAGSSAAVSSDTRANPTAVAPMSIYANLDFFGLAPRKVTVEGATKFSFY